MKNNPAVQPFWSIDAAALMQSLATGPEGLSGAEAETRRVQYAADALTRKERAPFWSLLLAQFKSPIILILVFAALLSLFLHDTTDALIILAIILLSGLLGFWQEHGASTAVRKLLALVEVRVAVLRDGREQEVPIDGVLPGDVVVLAAGGMVPGDALLLEEDNLYVDEAALTGETYPVEKSTGSLPADTLLAQRRNCLFMGTHVVSGTAKALVVAIGRQTELGRVADRLRLRRLETEFENGNSFFRQNRHHHRRGGAGQRLL